MLQNKITDSYCPFIIPTLNYATSKQEKEESTARWVHSQGPLGVRSGMAVGGGWVVDCSGGG